MLFRSYKRQTKLLKNNQKNAHSVLQQIQSVQIDSNLAKESVVEDDNVSNRSVITLKNKRTKCEEDFKLYEDAQLPFLHTKNAEGELLLDFNMSKLELEYDYDTDEE